MTIEIATVKLPASLASALVNGDLRGLDDSGSQVCAVVVDLLEGDGWYVVDVARDDDGETLRFSEDDGGDVL